MPAKFKFQEGEQILCFHGPLLYEAKDVGIYGVVRDDGMKCLKCEVKDKAVKYLVHYNGWSKNWDEWVPETRVLKFNEAGQQKQKELLKAHSVKPKTSKVKDKEKDKEKDTSVKEKEASDSSSKLKQSASKVPKSEKKTVSDRNSEAPSSENRSVGDPQEKLDSMSETSKRKKLKQTDNVSSDGLKKKKTKPDGSTVESEESYLSKIEVQIKLSKELRAWLADDWDLINRQKQLVQLPCKMNVETIIKEYLNERSISSKAFDRDGYEEVCKGLREYFNSMLSSQLLYKFERPQYSEIIAGHPDTPISQIYGASHLLRLFVKIGGLLAYSFQDSKSLQWLLEHFQDFLQYMTTHSSMFFSSNDYIAAPPEHLKKVL